MQWHLHITLCFSSVVVQIARNGVFIVQFAHDSAFQRERRKNHLQWPLNKPLDREGRKNHFQWLLFGRDFIVIFACSCPVGREEMPCRNHYNSFHGNYLIQLIKEILPVIAICLSQRSLSPLIHANNIDLISIL